MRLENNAMLHYNLRFYVSQNIHVTPDDLYMIEKQFGKHTFKQINVREYRKDNKLEAHLNLHRSPDVKS